MVNQDIEKIRENIASINIQGATNVAIATVEGMKLALKEELEQDQVIAVGRDLANTRLNEPMARNAVKYVEHGLRKGEKLDDLIDQYNQMIHDAKLKLKLYGGDALSRFNVVLTHCHSSSSTSGLIEAHRLNPNLKVVSTETRPKFQGRITSKELYDAGVDVTMIVDSISAAFIVDDSYLPVEAIVIGTDELLRNGSVINKLGSYQMALAANLGSDKFFVSTSLLKLDPSRDPSDAKIEMRSASEVWSEAPKDLNIINPAFEVVPNKLIDYFITEVGIIRPEEILDEAKKMYPWI